MFLQKFYETLKAADKKIEIVFVSQDRTEEELRQYFEGHQGPWAYLKFGDPKIKYVATVANKGRRFLVSFTRSTK